MTILELLKEDLEIKGLLLRLKQTNTNKYESPCPGCGGTNRFQLWDDIKTGGNFLCRKCDLKGGVINYLKSFRNMNYEQACLHAGISPASRGSIRNRRFPGSDIPKEIIPPPPQWQESAESLIRLAEKNLWSGFYNDQLKWLNEKRGLKLETIKQMRLGWIPQDQFYKRSDWGIPDKSDDNGKKITKLWIPQGLVIPCHKGNQLHRIRIRKHNLQDGSRYYFVPGSSTIPMAIGSGKYFIVVESELDAILLSQEASDLVGIISLGSADIRPYSGLIETLNKAERILISLDGDESGARASLKWWLGRYPNAFRLPPVKGKDPTEAYLNGLDLRKWIEIGIKYENMSSAVPRSDSPLPKFRLLHDEDHICQNLEILEGSNELSVSVRYFEKKQFLFMGSPDHPVVGTDMSSMDSGAIILLKGILEKPSDKIFYDAKSSLKALHKAGLNVNGSIFDVMLADQVLNAGVDKRNHSPIFLIEDHLGEGLKSGASRQRSHDLDMQIAAYETKKIIKLRVILAGKLEENNLTDTAKLEFDCIRSTMQMELNGFSLDIEKVKTAIDKYVELKENFRKELSSELGDINFDSHDQLKAVLDAKGLYFEDAKKETLLPFCDKYPILTPLLGYKECSDDLNKAKSLISYFNPETWRIYPQYNQIGAPTGRFSAFDPNIHGIKRGEFRSFFIASPGRKLIVADYSQIELRIAAEISGDQKMIEAYKSGVDLHKLTAAILSRKQMDHVTKEERQAAKAVNFGLIYAMSAKGLMEYARNKYGITMTLEQTKLFRVNFFQFYKGISQWQRGLENSFQSGVNESRTIGGRRRIMIDKVTRMFNSPVQGTSADITKRALCLLSERLTGTEVKIIGCIHDEIILEAPESESDKAREILRSTMIEAGEFYLKSVPVEVEVSVVDNWMEK